jgi:hypothetical protein
LLAEPFENAHNSRRKYLLKYLRRLLRVAGAPQVLARTVAPV